jgi:hypothetical protein
MRSTGKQLFFILLTLLFSTLDAIREEDIITDLPDVTFRLNFKHYSGYLNANTEGTWRLFYW